MTAYPLDRTDVISIQLSNQCNYAHLHPKCAAHHQTAVVVLPAVIVRNVLEGLAEGGFDDPKHIVCWHIYNEPLCDPRLSEFIRYARELLPRTIIRLWTNGWYLTPTLVAEFIATGMTQLFITAYGDERRSRLRRVIKQSPSKCTYKLMGGELDHRLDRSPTKFSPCRAPFRNLCIYPTGDVGLCCYDTNREVLFGSLHGRAFLDVMGEAYPQMHGVQAKLLERKRCTVPCGRCPGGR